MFKTIINFNTKLKEAASLGQPISEYDPASKGHKDFQGLADELIGTDTHTRRAELVGTLQSKLDAISASAEELLSTIKTPPRTPKTEPASAKAEATAAKEKTTDDKIADFYGVRQMEDAVMFVTLYPRAANVQVAGDFNNWQPEQAAMKKVGSNGLWQIKLPINKGKYRYRLVVDGQWQQDPYNETTEPNPYGEMNSVLEVR